MLLLMAFALLAGAGTAVTPCVLPVLPALLSSSAMGGRRRPLGIVLGLVLTHTVAIVALASVIDGVGLADGAIRAIAVAGLMVFGLTMLLPAVRDPLEARLSRISSRFGPSGSGDGFWSGMAVGGALGFVYAPCAGPIVAAVIGVGATQGASFDLVAIALAYGLGSGIVLFFLAVGGRRVVERIRSAGRGPNLQRALGGVLVITAVLMAFSLDVRFQTALANHFPSFLVNPTRGIEDSKAVENRLADLRGAPKFDSRAALAAHGSSTAPGAAKGRLPVLGPAPEFTNNRRWFNTPGGKPLTLKGLRGRVVLVDFWTYTCINCIRTFPSIRALHKTYRDKGLTIIGVHTPEFAFERKADNVSDAIEQNRLRYPVAQDNEYGTWEAYGNQYWPAKYLIDARGRVRYTHFGEGGEAETDAAVRSLLKEAGAKSLGAPVRTDGERPSQGVTTPETYLGYKRAEGFAPQPPQPGRGRYPGVDGALSPNTFALGGAWQVDEESATALGPSSLSAAFGARRVFLVLSSRGDRPRRVRVSLDGRPVTAAEAGPDVTNGALTVTRQRLYRLVSLPAVQQRQLRLDLDPGVAGFAFTFG